MGDSGGILRGLRDRDASYTLKDHVFMLVRLWRVDQELFRRGLMVSSNALNEELMDMLIKPLPYLSLGKEGELG